jgi:cytidylate kinase
VTATPEVRARRRFEELISKGADTTYEAVLADVEARDARDSGCAEAPLKPAEDAEVMDTSLMSIEDAVARAIALIDRARS